MGFLKRWKRPASALFVPGVHDYCDQWCERCPCAERCLSRAAELKAIQMDKETFGEEDVALDPNAGGYAGTRWRMDPEDTELFEALARDMGVPPAAIAWRDPLADFRDDLEDAENDDEESEAALLLCDQEEDVYSCFCIYERLIDEYQDGLYARLDVVEEEERGEERVEIAEDALEEINWYLELLFAKLKRAYYADSLYTAHEDEACRVDADGSARVALLALDASREAWKRVAEGLRESPREITWLLAVIEQIEQEVLLRFPAAPAFKRPGFEEE